jgi:hypothetical protein
MKHFIFFTACVFLASCDFVDIFGDGSGRWHLRRGAVVFYGDSSSVQIPDTVRAGEPFEVSATTFGSGCTRAAGMRVALQNRKAVLTPIDSSYSPGPNEACTMEQRVLNHRAELAFSEAGEALVIVKGAARGNDAGSEEVARFQYELAVVR